MVVVMALAMVAARSVAMATAMATTAMAMTMVIMMMMVLLVPMVMVIMVVVVVVSCILFLTFGHCRFSQCACNRSLFVMAGSQHVKMLSLVKDIPAVKEMLDKSKSILGWDLLDLCLNGPEDS